MRVTATNRRNCPIVVSVQAMLKLPNFGSLTEWLETPAGVVAQIQGHKPSATAEKHYKRRPLDLLRVHHMRIEAWILEQAGVAFDATASAPIRPTLAAIL